MMRSEQAANERLKISENTKKAIGSFSYPLLYPAMIEWTKKQLFGKRCGVPKEPVIFIALILCLHAFCMAVQNPVGSPPPELNVDSFYTKYLDCNGIPVFGSSLVDDRAFFRLRQLLDNVFGNRTDLRQVMVNEGFRCIIIAEEEQVTDVPEYGDMEPKAHWNQRARGFGGDTTSCGEENLLDLPLDRYKGENIFIHELAHSIHFSGLRKCEPDFQAKLDVLYKQAMDKGLYKGDYAATNSGEYWAESVQAFFDCDRENDKVHNHVNTREELVEYDPNMAKLVQEVFRITQDRDWRYQPYSQKLIVEKTRGKIDPDGLLSKCIWCFGFLVYGTENISDESMLTVARTVRKIFKERYDILKAMIDAGTCVIICQKDIDCSNFKQSDLVVRLSAGESAGTQQSKLIGDLVRIAYQVAGTRPIESVKQPISAKQSKKNLFMDVRFDQKVLRLYEAAMKKGLWHSSPAAENRFEYIAHGSMAFFNAGTITIDGNQAVGNRKQLTAYDPKLANFLMQVFLPSQPKD